MAVRPYTNTTAVLVPTDVSLAERETVVVTNTVDTGELVKNTTWKTIGKREGVRILTRTKEGACSLGIQHRVKSLRPSYTGLYPQMRHRRLGLSRELGTC